MKKKMIKKVSFDFDNTLNLEIVEEYALELINKGIEVWICTARNNSDIAIEKFGNYGWNDDLYEIANRLNIPNERIIFTNDYLKFNVINKSNEFLWHLDDCNSEVNTLNANGEVLAILRSGTNNWMSQCNSIINEISTLLWLDDYRDPFDLNNRWLELYAPRWENKLNDVVWVKNYDEFTNWILNNGLPNKIAFDHDLADTHYAPREFWDEKYNDWLASQGITEKTGMDCAKWLVEYCMDYNKKLPSWVIQSANKAGHKNIQGLLLSYMKTEFR